MQNRFSHFVGIITTLNKQISRIKNAEAKKLGISGSDLMCMFYLSQSEDGLFASDIAKATKMDKAAVSRTISSLQNAGYVEYKDIPEKKKYRTFIHLTERGRVVASDINDNVVRIVKEVTKEHSIEESEIMYQLLENISENLEEI